MSPLTELDAIFQNWLEKSANSANNLLNRVANAIQAVSNIWGTGAWWTGSVRVRAMCPVPNIFDGPGSTEMDGPIPGRRRGLRGSPPEILFFR
ncbi:MAG TPA: hypothetical protein DDZ83_11570 [Nitrospinae bacterium]|nr:hypothetical protein [Nitrospinota bacterium]